MTATEVNRRARMMAQLMGPAFFRWLQELLGPFIDVVANREPL